MKLIVQLMAATVSGSQLKPAIHPIRHLIGSRQRLLQAVARKVAECVAWPQSVSAVKAYDSYSIIHADPMRTNQCPCGMAWSKQLGIILPA